MRPHKIAIYIFVTIAILGIVCLVVPKDGWHIGNWNLRWPTLTEVLNDGSNETSPTDLILEDSIEVSTPGKDDPRYHLKSFYLALENADTEQVRVVHYGDSQIEEDRITNLLREELQKQYGGGGVGLLPLHQTIPTSSLKQWISINGAVQSTQGGPKRYLIYGPGSMRLNKGRNYGAMGQVAAMNNDFVPGSQSIVMNIAPYTKTLTTYHYFNQIRILADNISATITQPENQNPTTIIKGSAIFSVPDSTSKCKIHLNGLGHIYGISLEKTTGVIVDNIPMRGCSGTIFTRMDSLALSNFYAESNTKLIIMQYGGNMVPGMKSETALETYIEKMRKEVRFLRNCAPQASILFIGPSDMSTRINGSMATYPIVPKMDRLLAKMAKEEQIAYWSMFEAMGGEGSMIEWRKSGLAGSDYVHFTRSGANKIGNMLYEWIKWTPEEVSTENK
jgi:lysophospholipase L1-like esterase